MDISSLSKEEKLELLNKAKDAYYNTGQEIMSDWEYDQLEAELGLENKNYVGSKSGNYTVKHTFIMGSLAKIQVHKDKQTGLVDWEDLAKQFTNYMRKANHTQYIETTPKLDGCSFSAEFTVENNEFKFISCATRGDGTYGTDISHLFLPILETEYWDMIEQACENILDDGDILSIRGEILIPHSTFNETYAKQYTNPRSFVAGQVNQKADDFNEELAADLRFVCYDYRIIDGTTGKYNELSWMNPNDPTYKILSPYLNHIGELPDSEYCKVYDFNGELDADTLQEIYNEYEIFRENESEYALDGVVFKPQASARRYNDSRERPVDCVAMKFLPMSHETEIIDIIWNTKKTNEYKPIGIVKPIWLDGKKCQKVSLSNYNYIITKGCGIGAVVEISLAGDIIPHVLSVVKSGNIEDINLPEDSEIIQSNSGIYKLIKVYSDDNSKDRQQFIASANELNIKNVGPAAAAKLYDALSQDYDHLNNVLLIMQEDGYNRIINYFGKSKSVDNIITAMRQYAEHITVFDIIKSCCIPGCREKSAQVCAKILMGLPYDTRSISRSSYEWALNPESSAYETVMIFVEQFGISLNDEAEEINAEMQNNAGKIPVVMTGSPKAFGYKTKSEFLAAHPEYTDVGSSIKDCKILFTDDLNSTSGKMKQAAKYGVEVKLYESFSI